MTQKKTLIGVLASQDDRRANSRLITVFNRLYELETKREPNRINDFPFHFLFTGGTYDRLFFGNEKLNLPALPDDVADWLKNACGVTRLRNTTDGGVVILSYLICQRECSIIWPFLAPNAAHWQRNENLALTRLCDQWHAKRLMNVGSVMSWYYTEAELDANRNIQSCPPKLSLEIKAGDTISVPLDNPTHERIWRSEEYHHVKLVDNRKKFEAMTIALIAHNEMKNRMVEFAVDHEHELNQFGTILATGTTGREVCAATSRDITKKMVRHHSGPKGGDIEIATAVLLDHCDIVIFFVDPLSPHPHIDDIRVVFQACMVSDRVVMITNEMHAREFMSRAVRGKTELILQKNQ